MEGYALGVDANGQFFISVTTSNYPYHFVDDQYRVCTGNTIFLKTNLNNIAVANYPLLANSVGLFQVDPALQKLVGSLQGIMPDGKFEQRSAVLHGFEGQVVVAGFKDLVSEETVMFAAFSRYLRTTIYSKEGNRPALQLKNCNTVEAEVLKRYLKAFPAIGDRQPHFKEFKSKFIAAQISGFGIMRSAEAFFKAMVNSLASIN